MLDVTWIGFSPLVGSLLASLLAVYYFVWSRSRFVRLIDALPGPKTYPVLGNIFELNVAHDELLRKACHDWIKQHGSIYRVWFTVRPMVVIASPELLEPILSSNTFVTKADEYDCYIPLLGKSLAVAKPDEWKKNRRLLNPAFKVQILNSFMYAFNDKSLLCAKELEEAIESNNGGEINVFPIMTHCTMDIICETTMGGKTLTDEDKTGYIKNLHGFEKISQQRLNQPWLRLDWLFELSGPGRANARFVAGLRDFSNMLITHRRELVKRKMESAQNESSANPAVELLVDDDTKKNLIFMDLLLKEGDVNGNFNPVEMRDEVSSMMAGGHDTTALAFTWFLYLISRNPDKQKLIVDELNNVFGDSDRPCTTQDLAELKYLECCIKETLRLYPSIPFMMRRLPEDVEIGGYVLPKGVTIGMMVYGMHHNPQVYPDPEEFKPERFFSENSVDLRNPYAFIPFGAGPRNCIGQKFAMLELKVVLAHLMRRFQFSVSDPTEPMIIPLLETTLKPKSPVNLIVTKRSLQA